MKNSEETGSPGPGRKTSLLFAQMTAATLLIGFEWVQNTGACSARPRRRRGTRDSKPKKKTRGRRFAEMSPRLRRKERPELPRAREDAEHFAGQPRGPGKSPWLRCPCPAAAGFLQLPLFSFSRSAQRKRPASAARVLFTPAGGRAGGRKPGAPAARPGPPGWKLGSSLFRSAPLRSAEANAYAVDQQIEKLLAIRQRAQAWRPPSCSARMPRLSRLQYTHRIQETT